MTTTMILILLSTFLHFYCQGL